MPRNTATPRSWRPRTAPWGVRTTGPIGSAAIAHQPFAVMHLSYVEHHKGPVYSGARTSDWAVRCTGRVPKGARRTPLAGTDEGRALPRGRYPALAAPSTRPYVPTA
ncbi:hypothetical protein GCM10023100_17550 [Actinocorallia cavernae]|uniref:Uncharacterized protein n=2 Tax=Actinomycetes TaxID=1760 RepID=A0ABP8SEK7_9ACTN